MQSPGFDSNKKIGSLVRFYPKTLKYDTFIEFSLCRLHNCYRFSLGVVRLLHQVEEANI